MQKFEIEIKDLIENFYNSEYENLDKIIIKCEKTKEMENLKMLEKNLWKEFEERNKIENEILSNTKEKIKDNENKRLSIYNKLMYKQGFIDGINLLINCISRNNNIKNKDYKKS